MRARLATSSRIDEPSRDEIHRLQSTTSAGPGTPSGSAVVKDGLGEMTSGNGSEMPTFSGAARSEGE